VFFGVVGKEPRDVTAADVFAFLAEQRRPRRGEQVVRIEDGEGGLAARTIARRLSSVAGLFAYLLARGDAGVACNPVPRGLATRRSGQRGRGGVRLVRTPRTLPRVLSPGEVDRLLGALLTRVSSYLRPGVATIWRQFLAADGLVSRGPRPSEPAECCYSIQASAAGVGGR
jgi:integrase